MLTNEIFNPWYIGIGTTVACIVALAAHLCLTETFKMKKRKKDMPCGLINFGSTTCYCNVVLQCFAPLESLRIWLGSISNRMPSAVLHRETHEMLQALNNFCEPDILLLSSENILSALHVQDRFQYFTQQDCHEFFQLFCEKLQAAAGNPVKSGDVGLQSGTGFITGTNAPKFPLSGRISSRLKCTACNTIFPTTIEQFVALSLTSYRPTKVAQPARHNFAPLSDLLASFTNDELLTDATCEKCQKKCCLRKQTKIFSAPHIFVLHISRSNWMNDSVTKNGEQIIFPEFIDLSPFLQYKPSEKFTHLYRLRSVAVHFGSASSSGHFVAYRLSSSARKWCYTSDEEVRFVDRETVHSSEPYMLFYEKCEQPEIK